MDDSRTITRRAFLRGALAAAGAGVLAACAPGRQRGQPFGEPYNTATPARVLASPPAPQEAGTPAPQVDDPALAQFLALSALLTGVSNLDPVVGRVYLQSLQDSTEFDVTLEELHQQAGLDSDSPPESVADLEAQGLFEDQQSDEGAAALADRIIEYWYTGVYTTADGEQVVATYVDALAWKTLAFTKPNSICGTPGFWEERPDVTVLGGPRRVANIDASLFSREW